MKGLVGFAIGGVIGTVAGALGILGFMIYTAYEGDGCWFIDAHNTQFIEKSKLRTSSDEVTETE
jgi:hypothetical protein